MFLSVKIEQRGGRGFGQIGRIRHDVQSVVAFHGIPFRSDVGSGEVIEFAFAAHSGPGRINKRALEVDSLIGITLQRVDITDRRAVG